MIEYFSFVAGRTVGVRISLCLWLITSARVNYCSVTREQVVVRGNGSYQETWKQWPVSFKHNQCEFTRMIACYHDILLWVYGVPDIRNFGRNNWRNRSTKTEAAFWAQKTPDW